MTKNTQVFLAQRPIGEPTEECFGLRKIEIPKLGDNQILIRVCWLSLDPYMRGRMHDVKSYADPLQIGDVIVGESTGVVLKSTSPDFVEGDAVAAHMGWQSHIVANADDPRLMRVDLNNGSLSAHLGVVGMTGRTAYFGLTEVGKPQPGETLVVAAASGAVGSAVGQIAKIKGLRAVGIAGGPEKCRYVKEELKFDACIDYKAGNLAAELAAAICGYISNYNDEDLANSETPFHIFKALDPVPEHRFFVVNEWHDRWVEATRQLGSWVQDGRLKYRESVGIGLENAPEYFRGMLKGKNFGKQLIKVADED